MVKSLASKFLSIIESSIWVPRVLGSIAILTPVPKRPEVEEPTHPESISSNKTK